MRWQWHFGLGRDLGLAFWAMTFFEATLGAYSPVWPIWIERLGAPISVVGLVLGLSGLIRPFILGPGSIILDRFDTRTVLLVARSISVIGLIVAALSTNWTMLLITVVASAIGELVFPTIQTYVADHAGNDPVHAFNMVITIGPSAALILSPLLSGLIIALTGIRGALVLSAVLTVIALAFVSRMNFSRGTHSVLETPGAATYRSVFARPAMRRVIILHGATIGALAIGAALAPNFMEQIRGLKPSLITILSAGAAVGTILMGFTSARITPLRQSPILAASIATGIVSTGFILFASSPAVGAIAIAYLMRGGLFSAWAFFLAEMGHQAPAHLRSRGFATLEILGGSAISFGPVIAAQLWDIEPRVPFLVSAGLGLSMAIVSLTVALRYRVHAPLPT